MTGPCERPRFAARPAVRTGAPPQARQAGPGGGGIGSSVQRRFDLHVVHRFFDRPLPHCTIAVPSSHREKKPPRNESPSARCKKYWRSAPQGVGRNEIIISAQTLHRHRIFVFRIRAGANFGHHVLIGVHIQ